LHDRRDRPRGRDRQAPRQALGRRTRTLPPRRRRSPRPLAPPGRLTHPHSAALQGRGEPRTERQPPARDGKRQPSRGAGNRAQSDNLLHGTGNVSPPGARGTAHRATTPCTGRETSALQGRGEPRTEQQPPPHWTGNVNPQGARGTAHSSATPSTGRDTSRSQGREEPRTPPNDRWGPAPHRER